MDEENLENYTYYTQKVLENKKFPIELERIRDATIKVFKNQSDNYKQKLVYNLLETIKNNDQNRFFYILLKAINKPKEDFKELWKVLEKYYYIIPSDLFINFAYTIIIGIMATYKGEDKNEQNRK